jgi:hypothetical protein
VGNGKRLLHFGCSFLCCSCRSFEFFFLIGSGDNMMTITAFKLLLLIQSAGYVAVAAFSGIHRRPMASSRSPASKGSNRVAVVLSPRSSTRLVQRGQPGINNENNSNASMSHNAKPFDDDYFAVQSEATSLNVLHWIDKKGQSLKPAAAKASAKSTLVEGRWPKLRYHLQSCILYSLFIVYRAYRGFFVILPAVFRETFRKMETVVDGNPFDDAGPDIIRFGGPPRTTWRTRVTVSVLAVVVTASYVLGGFLRVMMAMIRGAQHGNIPQSFADAASVQERNEKMLLKRRAIKNFTAGELE